MSEPISIRLAQPEEAKKLSKLAIRSKAHWGYSSEFMEACREELTVAKQTINQPSFRHIVAEMSNEVVGYYILKQLALSECELEALFVEPSFIGKGIGRKLIQHAIETAAEAGATKIVIQGDPNATPFYLAMGAILQGERESESIPGRYLPLFLLNIQGTEPHVV